MGIATAVLGHGSVARYFNTREGRDKNVVVRSFFEADRGLTDPVADLAKAEIDPTCGGTGEAVHHQDIPARDGIDDLKIIAGST